MCIRDRRCHAGGFQTGRAAAEDGDLLFLCCGLEDVYKRQALLGVMFFSLTGMIGASVVNGLNTYLYKDCLLYTSRCV